MATFDEILSALGEEGQSVPGAIMVHREGSNVVVAAIDHNGSLKVTDEGQKILDDLAAPAEEAKPAKAPKKAKAAAPADAPAAPADVVVDDLDLDA